MIPTAPAAAVRRTTLTRVAGPVLAALLLALAVLLASAPRAAAHNSLLGTDPEDGATVATPPARVTLTFDQPAQAIGTEVVVTGPDGSTVSTGTPELVDGTVAQALADELPAGDYTVQWRVTSADGHPLSGELTFTATAATPPQAAEPEAPSSPAPSAASTPEPTSTTAGSSTVDDSGATTAEVSSQEEAVEDEDAGLEAGVVAAVVVAVLAAGAVAVFVVRERRRAAAGRTVPGGDGPEGRGPDGLGPDGDERDGRAGR